MSGLSIHPEGVKFDSERDIPDLTGRNILVTGGISDILTARLNSTNKFRYWRYR